METAKAAGNEKSFDRSSWRTLTFAFIFILAAIVLKAYRLSFATEGWSSTTDFTDVNPIFSRNLLGLPSPLQAGDKLLAVNGHTFAEFVNRSLDGQVIALASSYTAGNRVHYTVLRDGTQVELDVPLADWTAQGMKQAAWQLLWGTPDLGKRTTQVGGVVIWLVTLLIIFVFRQRPRYLPTQLLFLACIASVAGLIGWAVGPFLVSDLLWPTTTWIAWLTYFHNALFVFPLQLHLLLVFPTPKQIVQRHFLLIPILYFVPWVIFALTSLLPDTDSLFFLLMALYQSLSLATVLHTLVVEKERPQRAQIRWLMFGAGIWSLSLIVFILLVKNLLPDATTDFVRLFPKDLLLAICIVIAILRYRLFDIDVILNRALVYGGLTAGVIGIYALIVGGIGSLVQMQGNVLLSLFATGLTAVAFQPLRLRLQTMVNHLLYGERKEPYQVLRKLSGKMEGTLEPAKLLPTMIETVAETLKLPYAAIVLGQAEEAQIVAAHGVAGGKRLSLPLSYQGEMVGELWIAPPLGENFQRDEINLLKIIAQQTSVAAYAVKQNLDLQRSRTRLVTAREEERRRIRRDLHDGLGPTLANFAMRLEQARESLPPDAEESAALLAALTTEAQGTISDVRRLVYQLRPPDLDEYGLVSALREYLHRMQPKGTAITLQAPEVLPSLPAAVEVAAYRIVQEAVNNAVKHAQAGAITVTLALPQALAAPPSLAVEICDNGMGLQVDHPVGIGLHSMRERAEELGGSCLISNGDNGGVQVIAHLPIV